MNIAAYLLVWAGVVVVAGTSTRLLLAPEVFARLHFVGPATALGAPLITAGLALAPGVWSSVHDVLKLVVIGLLLFATGPAAVVATARAAHLASGRRDPGGEERDG